MNGFDYAVDALRKVSEPAESAEWNHRLADFLTDSAWMLRDSNLVFCSGLFAFHISTPDYDVHHLNARGISISIYTKCDDIWFEFWQGGLPDFPEKVEFNVWLQAVEYFQRVVQRMVDYAQTE